MKFNYSLTHPKFEFSNQQEKDQINEFRKELLQEFSNYLEAEALEIYDMIENIYYSELIIEVLERERLNTKLNLAFNSFFYKENCFYLDENRTPKITEDENVFNHFYHVFVEKDKDKATGIACGILRVRLIEYISNHIATGKDGRILFPPKYATPDYPDHIFKDFESYQYFKYLLKEYGEDEKNKINKKFVSALFHLSRTKCSQLEFATYWNKNFKEPKISIYKNSKARLAPLNEIKGYIKKIKDLEKI